MLRNDEEYKEYLEDIEPYHGDPVGYLKYFSVKRREIYSQIQRNYAWYLAITRRRETISVLDSTRGKQGSQVSACLEGRSKSCIIKYGATCVNRRQRYCSTF
ncbi:BBT_collapsed_G0005100.mRNA.1.CDS.1 [Saccharomyces cerevisiae]|nr:BBT_collapsed_G0005100.mRNA.1.CDS.1 [Saccharomyces cerevisiae]